MYILSFFKKQRAYIGVVIVSNFVMGCGLHNKQGMNKEVESSLHSCHAMNYPLGIDVSHHNGDINWAEVKDDPQNISFVFIKATEGATFKDHKCVYNWQQVSKEQCFQKKGLYHFYHADVSARNQANNIYEVVNGISFDKEKDYIIIDVEKECKKESKDRFADNLHLLLQDTESLLSCKPMIYTRRGFWNSNVDYNKYPFEEYKLWVAHWTNKPEPTMPGKWKNWAVWQYTNKGKVGGIGGNVDLNRMMVQK